jgi:hypothetical protein
MQVKAGEREPKGGTSRYYLGNFLSADGSRWMSSAVALLYTEHLIEMLQYLDILKSTVARVEF